MLDAWGRITEIHTPEGGVERYTYDYAGNITGAEDANGGIVTYRYNSLGRYMRLPTRKGIRNPFTATKKGGGRRILTATAMWSAPSIIWTTVCPTSARRTKRAGTRW